MGGSLGAKIFVFYVCVLFRRGWSEVLIKYTGNVWLQITFYAVASILNYVKMFKIQTMAILLWCILISQYTKIKLKTKFLLLNFYPTNYHTFC